MQYNAKLSKSVIPLSKYVQILKKENNISLLKEKG